MDFNLDEKHVLARDLFREFAQREVAPLAQEVDETHRFPEETVRKLHENGMLSIPFPKEVGGQGGDTLAYALCVEEMAKACGSTAVIISVHTSACCGALYQFATPEQKEKYLRPLLEGGKLGAFALTEPEAGTDAAGQKTTAVLDGDEYVINGTKIFITNAGYADTYVVFAMTDRSKGTKGISAFIVEKGTPGFTFGTTEKKMGIHGSATRELIFQDCRIPKENLLGKEGKGFTIAMVTLDGGRIGIASQALGLAEGAFEKTLEYVKERKQFGKPLSRFQNTQFRLADMATQIEAARLLVYRAALAHDTQERYSVEAAQAKLVASRTAMAVTTECVQLMGGYGYMQEYDVERMMRDAKITEIYEGTSEVMEMVISGSLLR